MICCNPKHLFIGTPAENSADRNRKGRNAKGRMMPHAKLTDEIVREIRATTGYVGLQRKYGISPGAIWFARKRVTWNHID
jgi:hypothetical protein